eukprot:TRINITY_DN31430_c0_g1_i1.p1 TRINITY_DN31430_c0_g1~~TRINITY_DN31430_c0_g1_i1.p1  ORF type:complete len:153 (+),score=35.31 TRINITY_DN31430_c0_g1_i1:59-460(+)
MAITQTHKEIDEELCGKAVEIGEGKAIVELKIENRMRVDSKGLAHGGFVFGAVDYAAMLAVNDPNVVLGEANTRFMKPVKVGDTLVCTATVTETKGKKRIVVVTAEVQGRSEAVLQGTLTAFVLPNHVLDGVD